MILKAYLYVLIFLLPYLALSPWNKVKGMPGGIIFVCLVAVFVIGVIIDRPYLFSWQAIKKTPLIVPLGIFIVANVMSLISVLLFKGKSFLWANNFKEIGYLIFATVFYWAVHVFTTEDKKLKQVLKVFLLSFTAASLYCIIRLLSYMAGLSFGFAQPWTVPRLTAPGGESQVMGGFIITVLPLAIAAILYNLSLFKKLASTFLSIILLTALIMTFSAGAWLGFGMAMVFLAVWFNYYNAKSVLICLLVFCLAGSAIILIDKTIYPGYLEGFISISQKISGDVSQAEDIKNRKVEDVLTENLKNGTPKSQSTVSQVQKSQVQKSQENKEDQPKYAESIYSNVERIRFRQALWAMFKSSPLLGVGPGNFEVLYEKYRPDGAPKPNYLPKPHNQYMEILAEIGIVGFASFLVIVVNIIYLFAESWYCVSEEDKKLLLGLMASLFAVAVHGYVFGILVHIQMWLLLALVTTIFNKDLTVKSKSFLK